MHVLAVDTSTNWLSASVSRGGNTLCEINLNLQSTHSKHILKIIDQITANSGISLDEIDLFAATKGPGSFTGLRIGLSAMKGLAYSLNKPLVTISTLEAIAMQTDFSTDYLCPVIDARKNEVYYSVYKKENFDNFSKPSEHVGNVDELLDRIDGSATFAGSGALIYKEKLSGYIISSVNYIRASNLSNLACEKFSNFSKDELISSEPEYIRKSDAELNLKK